MKKALFQLALIASLPCMLGNAKSDKLADAIRGYTIVGDFEKYPQLAEIGQNLFWTYPFLPNNGFTLDDKFAFEVDKADIPPTTGAGLLVQHLNRGRDYFLRGDYNEAAKIWRSATVNFSKSDPYYRRLSLFTAFSFIKMVKPADKSQLSRESLLNIAAAARLLSDALGDQGENFDSLLERVGPKYFYYLACLYYLGDDMGKATLAAQRGVDAMSSEASSRYRSELRFLLADTYRANQDFLLSAQQLDAVIREEQNLPTAVRAFEKIGDLYFGLNNFPLAQDFYLKAVNLGASHFASDMLNAKIGETKFWTKDFDGAVTFFQSNLASRDVDFYKRSWMKLRLADIELAKNRTEVASLKYFDLSQTLVEGIPRKIARIRQACIDIPALKVGSKAVTYTSGYLRSTSDLKRYGKTYEQTLATSCYVASLLKTQDHKEFIQRINAMQAAKPESPFVPMVVAMGKKIQSERLAQLLAAKMYDDAIKHYEVYKDILYANLTPETTKELFKAYVFHGEYDKARGFYDSKSPNRATLAEVDYLFAVNKEMDAGTQRRVATLTTDSLRVIKSDLPYMRRILQAGRKGYQFNWMLKNFKFNLMEVEQCQFLGVQAPIAFMSPLESTKETQNLFSKVIDNISNYQQLDANCMDELANAEFVIYENQAEALSNVYLARSKGWWLVPHTADLAWQISEKIGSAQPENRLRILKKIAETGNPSRLVVKYARNQIQSVAH